MSAFNTALANKHLPSNRTCKLAQFLSSGGVDADDFLIAMNKKDRYDEYEYSTRFLSAILIDELDVDIKPGMIWKHRAQGCRHCDKVVAA